MKKLLAVSAMLSLMAWTSVGYAGTTASSWTCTDDTETYYDEHPEEWQKLAHAFIDDIEAQRMMTICTRKKYAFVLVEDFYEHTVRGGIYSFARDKKYREKKGHDFSVLCEILESSNSRRINYLCYNPTVASSVAIGDEFSFRLPSKRSYQRACMVNFPPLPDPESDCEKWERVK